MISPPRICWKYKIFALPFSLRTSSRVLYKKMHLGFKLGSARTRRGHTDSVTRLLPAGLRHLKNKHLAEKVSGHRARRVCARARARERMLWIPFSSPVYRSAGEYGSRPSHPGRKSYGTFGWNDERNVSTQRHKHMRQSCQFTWTVFPFHSI